MVLRADICTIIVREGSNIQDNSVVHGAPEVVVEIGPHATIATAASSTAPRSARRVCSATPHGAGRRPRRRRLAGGRRIGHHPGTTVPEGVLAAGAPAQVRKPIEGTGAAVWVETNAPYYADLARRHRAGVRAIEGPSAHS